MEEHWILIGADNAQIGEPVDVEPTPGEGERVEVYPGDPAHPVMRWSQAANGWVDIPAPVLISIAAFMLLFTQAERLAIRAARNSGTAGGDKVDDFWMLLLGCTSGLALQHPMVVAGVTLLASEALVSSGRASEILAGTPVPIE